MHTDQRIKAAASHAIGLEVLRRCTRVLQPLGIYAMPLKGIWLQSYVYAGPEERTITDVDVLVPDRAFSIARRALLGAGFEARSANVSEVALYARDLPLAIDLHARLFMPGAFALPTQALFARASAPVELEGARIVLPDPLDGLCHLVGHFVKNRSTPDDARRTRDFAAIAQRFALTAPQIAARLDEAGMGRAARYAFSDLAHADPLFADVLAALARDPTGELLARACARARTAARPGALSSGSSRLGRAAQALPGFLLERSLPAAGKALLLRAVSLSADRPYT